MLTAQEPGLRYAMRDLETLDLALRHVPGRTACVQAGGHQGIFARRLAESFASVYVFEPHPDNFTRLCRTVTAAHVVKLQAALGADRGLVGLKQQRRDGKPSAHSGVVHVSGAGQIPVLRVDDLALRVCDFLCLDVEGYEVFALRGARETIRRCRPVIMLEVSEHAGALGFPPDYVRESVRQYGYQQTLTRHSDEVWVSC